MSARVRLTLSYAGFLLIAGAAQAALLIYIIRFVPDGNLSGPVFVPNRSDLLEALWPRIWQVLAVLLIVGLVGGWFLAGRMLRPLHRIHAVARGVAAGSLSERVRLTGSHDEFRELADTFDRMLDRLEQSFDQQGRFAADAAHELRTPYAITRSLLDVARADPAGQDLHELVHRLDETNRKGIEVVEALLTLAQLDHGRTLEYEPVDLVETVTEVLRELGPLAFDAGITIRSELGEGDTDGSPTLIRQLVSNLVVNAIRHNLPSDGWMQVMTASLDDGSVELAIVNSGPVVDPESVGRLTQPFVRGVARVSTRGEGHQNGPTGSGLGLALVARVANVHSAALHIEAPPSGGLRVRVRFSG